MNWVYVKTRELRYKRVIICAPKVDVKFLIQSGFQVDIDNDLVNNDLV